MGLRVAEEGGDVVVCEEGICEDLGGREAGDVSRVGRLGGEGDVREGVDAFAGVGDMVEVRRE